MKHFKTLIISVIILTAILPLSVAYGEETEQPSPTRMLIFYDSTQQSHFLWPYRFRILVLEDIAGSGGLCWTTYPNGTTALNPERCRPLSNLRLKIYYAELKEGRDVVTDNNGVAETEWRIFTYPKSTFMVKIDTQEYVVERLFTVESRPWTLTALLAFSSMLSAMVYTLRRGLW